MTRKTVITLARNGTDVEVFAYTFVVEKSLDLLAAVRAAASEFSRTQEGKGVLEYTNGCFNWGDFINHVPQETCRKYGFFLDEDVAGDIVVDHDEYLIDLDEEEGEA